MSKPIEAHEAREMLLEQIAHQAALWSTMPNISRLEMCNAVAKSIIQIFAGCYLGGLPRIELTLRPERGDEEFREIEMLPGYFVNGTRIDEPPLHESWDAFKHT